MKADLPNFFSTCHSKQILLLLLFWLSSISLCLTHSDRKASALWQFQSINKFTSGYSCPPVRQGRGAGLSSHNGKMCTNGYMFHRNKMNCTRKSYSVEFGIVSSSIKSIRLCCEMLPEPCSTQLCCWGENTSGSWVQTHGQTVIKSNIDLTSWVSYFMPVCSHCWTRHCQTFQDFLSAPVLAKNAHSVHIHAQWSQNNRKIYRVSTTHRF